MRRMHRTATGRLNEMEPGSLPQEASRVVTETAYVLYMDLAGFSRAAIAEQAALSQYLRDVVRATAAYSRAVQQGNIIGLDTGDGMALVFFQDPLSPVECAAEV